LFEPIPGVKRKKEAGIFAGLFYMCCYCLGQRDKIIARYILIQVDEMCVGLSLKSG
jgi:hypothetical protein